MPPSSIALVATACSSSREPALEPTCHLAKCPVVSFVDRQCTNGTNTGHGMGYTACPAYGSGGASGGATYDRPCAPTEPRSRTMAAAEEDAGRESVKTAPPPGALSTEMLPSCASTTPEAGETEAAASPFADRGAKRRRCARGRRGTPGPSSRTRTTPSAARPRSTVGRRMPDGILYQVARPETAPRHGPDRPGIAGSEISDSRPQAAP